MSRKHRRRIAENVNGSIFQRAVAKCKCTLEYYWPYTDETRFGGVFWEGDLRTLGDHEMYRDKTADQLRAEILLAITTAVTYPYHKWGRDRESNWQQVEAFRLARMFSRLAYGGYTQDQLAAVREIWRKRNAGEIGEDVNPFTTVKALDHREMNHRQLAAVDYVIGEMFENCC